MKEISVKHQLKIAIEKCNLRISLHGIFAYLVLPTFVLHMMLVYVIGGEAEEGSDLIHQTHDIALWCFWIHVFTIKFCFCGKITLQL